MGWLKDLAGRRLEVVGQKRLALAGRYLWPDERVMHNAPLERVVVFDGRVQTQPVIVFGTSQRVLVVPYDGSAKYLPANEPCENMHLAARHGHYIGFQTRVARGAAGSWKALGALLFSGDQVLELPPQMASSVFTVTEGADAAGGALGAFGRQTIEHLGDYIQPPFSRCALFGFPIDSPVIDNLVRFVDGQGTHRAGRHE